MVFMDVLADFAAEVAAARVLRAPKIFVFIPAFYILYPLTYCVLTWVSFEFCPWCLPGLEVFKS